MVFSGEIVLYPEVMFRKGGEVHDWSDKVTAHFTYWAIREAPERSGELKASIWGEVSRTSRLELAMDVGADAEHALYVLRGTDSQAIDGPVRMYNESGMTKQGRGRRSSVSQSGRSLVPSYLFRTNKQGKRHWIEGQPENNFLAFAFYRTKGRYRSIGSYSDNI
jgi:hypothetical protein